MSTADYSAQLQRESDWQRQLMQDRQMRDNPGMSQAAAGGWELQPDGNYRRMINGVTQTMPAGMLAGNMQAQGMAQQVSNPATIGGNTDYVGQLKALLGERQQSASIPNGASSIGAFSLGSIPNGASSVPLTNPYEQRLQELMSNPDTIANTNAYRFRLNEGQQAIERSAAAKGMLRSGNTLAALANYGQGAASQEYGNEVSRLGALTGQQNQYSLGRMGMANQEQSNALQGQSSAMQYNLGRMNAANQEQSNSLQAQANAESAWQNRTGTALSALIAGNRDKLATNELAATNAVRTGYINPGSTGRASTW